MKNTFKTLPIDVQKYIMNNIIMEYNDNITRAKFENTFADITCNADLNPPEIVDQHKFVFQYQNTTYVLSPK